MQRLLAIVGLTWKAAFRYRLFWILIALLLAAVVGLPMLIKDDGTAEGFVQIVLTYTLGAVSGLMGMCTLWLSCGTLARDIEENQIQMVAVKPIARWQIWLGKWLGIVSLNTVLLAVAGGSIFGLLEWRASKLPEVERAKLQNEVLVARASVKEQNLESSIQEETDRILKDRLAKHDSPDMNPALLRVQIEQLVRAQLQAVPPGGLRTWVIHLGAAKDSLENSPLYLRVKFNTAIAGGTGQTYITDWLVGTPKKTQLWEDRMSLSPDTFHEFKVPPHLLDEKGDLVIFFRNMNNTALLFTLDEGMEVLYRQGGFGLNFVRGLAIILFWMALLAALGLMAATFLSFPVAAFFSLALLTIAMCSGTLSNVVSDGTIAGWNEEKSIKGHSAADSVVIPIFKGLLEVVSLVKNFSPIDSLSTGRNISWTIVGLAFAQIVLLFGGILALIGIFIFNRRELATAQGTN